MIWFFRIQDVRRIYGIPPARRMCEVYFYRQNALNIALDSRLVILKWGSPLSPPNISIEKSHVHKSNWENFNMLKNSLRFFFGNPFFWLLKQQTSQQKLATLEFHSPRKPNRTSMSFSFKSQDCLSSPGGLGVGGTERKSVGGERLVVNVGRGGDQ